MNVICTGISKSNKLGYFKKVEELSDQLCKKTGNKKVKIYSVGDIMKSSFMKHNITVNEHILNKDDELLSQAAESAIKTIKNDMLERKLRGEEETHNIISTHTTFMWNNHWKDSHNEKFIDLLNPDLFITILDHEKRIQNRQHNDSQWQLQKLGLAEIALWQDLEAQTTSEWAKTVGNKKHVLFGLNQSPETLYKIMNYPCAPVIYSNFPMTWLQNKEESYAKITFNNEVMAWYGSVIDPRTIEIMKAGEGDFSFTKLEQEIYDSLLSKQRNTKLEEKMIKLLSDKKTHEENIIKRLTTHRDLDFYVAKSDICVLYFPELVLSFGGVSEQMKAYRSSKKTFLIIPEEFKGRSVGPFEEYHALKIFYGQPDFHSFLDKNYEKLPIFG